MVFEKKHTSNWRAEYFLLAPSITRDIGKNHENNGAKGTALDRRYDELPAEVCKGPFKIHVHNFNRTTQTLTLTTIR